MFAQAYILDEAFDNTVLCILWIDKPMLCSYSIKNHYLNTKFYRMTLEGGFEMVPNDGDL